MTDKNGGIEEGDQRDGDRRWTGCALRPAGHVPWPELFRKHTLGLTKHLKMLYLVRGYYAEGSTNYTMAQGCIDRTQEMMKTFEKAASTFQPVVELPTRSPEARNTSATDQETAKEELRGIKQKKSDAQQGDRQRGASEEECGEPMEGLEESTSAEALFFIDLNPTPLDQLLSKAVLSHTPNANRKPTTEAKKRIALNGWQEGRAAEYGARETQRTKRIKTQAASTVLVQENNPEVPQAAEAKDEFDLEVEARHQQKEERRKRKQEKKRKRESDATREANDDVKDAEVSIERPRKRKHKIKNDSTGVKEEVAALVDGSGKANLAASTPDGKQTERKTRRGKRKRQSTDGNEDTGNERSMKRAKREKCTDKA